MRIPIREQLGLLILLSSLIGLAVVSVATWISNHEFVLGIRSSRLTLTASLKAAQLASNLNLMQTSANFIGTRVLIQSALQRYNADGNNTADNWALASSDMADAISGSGSLGQKLLLQTQVFPASADGPQGPYSVLNTTSAANNSSVRLPYTCPDGSAVYLGDEGTCGEGLNLGYPPMLYPNLTHLDVYYNDTFNQSEVSYQGTVLKAGGSPLLLGPYQVNSSYFLVSMTMPVANNTSSLDILGWLTVVMDASLIQQVIASNQGLGKTGQTLIAGPTNNANRFPADITKDNGDITVENFQVQYVLPLNSSEQKRHPNQSVDSTNTSFAVKRYPALQTAFTQDTGDDDNAGALIKTHDEAKKKVSVGFALLNTGMVDWAVLVEQSQSEVWEPIDRLRDILLACVFATAALMAIIAFPLAHMFSLPIRRLRAATAKSIEVPGTTPSRSSLDSFRSDFPATGDGTEYQDEDEGTRGDAAVVARKEGFRNPVLKWQERRREEREQRREARRRRQFKIPGKVKESKRSCVKDELTDLTSTFNEMSDELMMQYERLEERVQQRTAELELSKEAAEAANESKTLFIANISHELKTPLNGILGMCAVCMQEDDPTRLKRSLGIIYKSGDLLLNLLTDLLTFSKNQVGQHLTLDEKEFRLRDINTQLLAIFDKQAKEGNIDLKVRYEGVPDSVSPDERNEFGPAGTGRIKDMVLWGDTHRILQVLINLVSNALKFTPAGGSVTVTIRCLPEMPELGSRKGSMISRQSKQRSSRHKGSDATLPPNIGTANAINLKDRPNAMSAFSVHERAASPPPGKFLYFEFDVTDTGPGIPESLQSKIFEPFVQGDLGLSKKYGGTGLGLSICSQLASLMKGSVGVQSTVGIGSSFHVKIPLRLTHSQADSTASSSIERPDARRRSISLEDSERGSARHSRHLVAPTQDGSDGSRSGTTNPETANVPTSPGPGVHDSQPRLVGLSQPFFAASEPMDSPGSQSNAMERIKANASRSSRIRVLVAEDNKVNQEVVLRMLKLEDIYDVTVAKDGQEALDRVKESMRSDHESGGVTVEPYNLIFMDVQMPNVDGLQSTRLIREVGFSAPIVALTAFAEESNIQDCLESGMNYFLSKPIRRPQLKKVLKEYCAPIPEEENEDLPATVDGGIDGRRGSGERGTTIIMNVNSPSQSQSLERQRRGDALDSGSRPTSPKSAA